MNIPKMRIKILKNGPYLVFGQIPLSEKLIAPKGEGYEWREGRALPQLEQYALCRCGKTKNAPFCDGMHAKTGFQGNETAEREPFENRCEVYKGPDLDLLDDYRCAFARFCHTDRGIVWELVDGSDDPVTKQLAIETVNACPAGRLVAQQKNGDKIEPEFEPSIEIIQDPENNVSGGIFVKGNIPIESSDGQLYEIRNRMVLCRCGHSHNFPFCDATHVQIGYLS